MSRRKQAKPRAFLKAGDGDEDPAAAANAPSLNDPTTDGHLLDPKEELLSDEELESLINSDDEDDDANSEGHRNDDGEEDELIKPQHELPHNHIDSGHQGKPETSAELKEVPEKRQQNAGDTIAAVSRLSDGGKPMGPTHAAAPLIGQRKADGERVKEEAAKAVDNNMSKLGKNIDECVDERRNPLADDEDGVEDGDEDLEEDELDGVEDDEDDDLDDDDLLSLDSYYSDMYSTHTSSSYSPSISDGTITPNSLHHLHASATGGERKMNGDHNGDLAGDSSSGGGSKLAESLNNNNNSNTNNNNATGHHIGGEHIKRPSGHHHHHHHRLHGAESGGHHLHHKLPKKIRLKIDRESATDGGGKYDKLTGDGIKSGNGGNNVDGSYQCQFCDKSFPRLGYLKKHEQSHAEHLPFKCDYCARLFKHKRSRDRHTKLHTGDRRYRCPHCEAAFSRSDHLKIHMKTHDNQKPFQCTICNRGYNTAAALTSHMQNHKKQAAILAAGGNPQALNYSPRSTGSASSNGSLHKRRYAVASIASDSSPSRLDFPKRVRSSLLQCSFCTKGDFATLEQLNNHVQTMHEKKYAASMHGNGAMTDGGSQFQLTCEYCTMKFPSIPSLFQHMRSTHVDRLTSPNSYFEHFNRLAASGTFSPRLGAAKSLQSLPEEVGMDMKTEPAELSPKNAVEGGGKTNDEEPTDLSQNKRRSETPHRTPQSSPPQHSPPEKPGVFFCNQCNAGLPDFESFRNHLKSHIAHGLQMVCHHCGLSLRDQSEYERHVIGHFLISSVEYHCPGGSNCSSATKSYAKPEELQKHLAEQHAILMYKCSLCSDLFDSKVAIQVHFACTHTAETKILRCSACMEVFRSETDFNVHVKSRHQNVTNPGGAGAANATAPMSLQCMFCRAVCASELEMHFHLAAHARQFRCPSCPETFHVEFLLDRHMQSHHGGQDGAANAAGEKAPLNYEEQASNTPSAANPMSPMNSLYVNALFGGKGPLMPLAAQNNNNSILDYNVAFAAHLNKGLFPGSASGKFYSPLQVDTNAMKHPALMYGLSQRYFDTNRTLMDMYAQHHHQQQQQQQQQQDKSTPTVGNYFISPKQPSSQQNPTAAGDLQQAPPPVKTAKSGVSLHCAYCSGNFKSRSELEHHMKTCHNSTGKHKCLICDEVFPSPAILAEHKLQHSKVGQSGMCSHCSKPLGDVSAFRAHLGEHNNPEGQMPVQCICCRQSLHSDFEVGLHAKYHTKSNNVVESCCALCLEPLPPNSPTDAKVCEKCWRKHNNTSAPNSNKYKTRDNYERTTALSSDVRHYIENRCNLCKMILPHPHKLQEHLVEHTFAGCEDRGFICYICSAVFTAPSGLLAHMTEHGLNSRPYDCNLCTEKFYFRAELDHHLIEHEMRDPPSSETSKKEETPKRESRSPVRQPADDSMKTQMLIAEVKKELPETDGKTTGVGDDDEYIEVEKVATDQLGGHQSSEENADNESSRNFSNEA